MPETYSDVIPVPGQTTGTAIAPADLLASYSPPPLIKGGTVATGQGALPAGTPMALNSSTKKYVAYANGGGTGTGVCVGILMEAVDTTSSPAGDKMCNIIMRGTVKHARVAARSNYHAGILTDLNARIIDRSTAGSNDEDYLAF